MLRIFWYIIFSKQFTFLASQILKFILRSSSMADPFVFLSHAQIISVLLPASCLPLKPSHLVPNHFPNTKNKKGLWIVQPKSAILKNEAGPIYDVDPVSHTVHARKRFIFILLSNYTFFSSFSPWKNRIIFNTNKGWGGYIYN